MMKGGRAIGRHVCIWMRNDLRVHDNELFHLDIVKSAASVTCLYCIDPRNYKRARCGARKTGVHRSRFLLSSLADLRGSLQNCGLDLLVFHDRPENVIWRVTGASGCKANALVYHKEVTHEELQVEQAIEQNKPANCIIKTVFGTTLYHPDDLPFARDELPEPFTKMRLAIEKHNKVPVRKCFPCPAGLKPSSMDEKKLASVGLKSLARMPALRDLGFTASDVRACQEATINTEAKQTEIELLLDEVNAPGISADPRSAIHNLGAGETGALARVEAYIKQGLSTYKTTRNGLVGTAYSTKFSIYLAHGCLSPRHIYWRIREFDQQAGGSTVHTYWVIFELLWRDFFRWYCLKHGNSVFFLEGPKGRKVNWRTDPAAFEAWSLGRTGVPFVDANMRELLCTGFMSNRGRQNVASYLVHDLMLDWRLGAAWFESLLIDHDVTSNYGNWVHAAGLAGGRINRFNLAKQARDYDPKGEYVKLWCPELDRVPISEVHAPWKLPIFKQKQLGCLLGRDYPKPLTQPQFGGGKSGGGGRGGEKRGWWKRWTRFQQQKAR